MAYINNDEMKAIRAELKELKKEFGKSLKFSVRRDNYSSVRIALMQWDEDLSSLENRSINHYHIRKNYGDTRFTDLMERVNDIAHNAPGRAGLSEFFDESDAMTDYFHTAWYVTLEVGKWDKPYTQKV